MSDRKNEKIWGCGWDDPKPRMSGRTPVGGQSFVVGPTQALNPAPDVSGKVQSTKNIRNK